MRSAHEQRVAQLSGGLAQLSAQLSDTAAAASLRSAHEERVAQLSGGLAQLSAQLSAEGDANAADADDDADAAAAVARLRAAAERASQLQSLSRMMSMARQPFFLELMEAMLERQREEEEAEALALAVERSLTDGGGGGGGTAAPPAGLSAREIAAALPAMPFSEARNFLVDGVSRTECTICLGDFADDDEVRALPCVHIFHSACIDRWLARATCCPTCKGGAT